ncbi:hypothetical protein [Fischerella sp. JS2]|uniref:hypothetical protein n=1 Tax=Fischerella sp. JS2 TaxID=2597771 RepID=UPI0028E68C0F|nr:hypothetical protein [Fischerella sp. JS2]
MNIRQSSIKNALLSFGLLLFASTLSLAVSTSVSAGLDKDISPGDITSPFPFCPRLRNTDNIPLVNLIPTKVQLRNKSNEFGSGSQQTLFISVRNEGSRPYSPPKNALIEVIVNGTPYTGIVYGSAAAQYQLGGAIARCETGGIEIKDTFPTGTFQIGQKVGVRIPSNKSNSTNEVTLTIE